MTSPHTAPTNPLSYADMELIAQRLRIKPQWSLASSVDDGPLMEGKLLGVEVQRGLFANGYSVKYLQDVSLDQTVEASLLCAFPLVGLTAPMHIDGYGEVDGDPSQPLLVCFGQARRCRSICKAGGRCVVAGFTIRPEFVDHLSGIAEDRAIRGLIDLFDKDLTVLRFPSSSRLRSAAARLFDESYSGTLARLNTESCTLALVAETARLLDEANAKPPNMSWRHYDQVLRARELLDGSIAAPPTIGAMTKEFGVNATTLRANFRKAFGTSIFGHVRNRRMEVAQFLLRTNEMSVAEVGHCVGFTNAAAFATAYRLRFGYPPRAETGSRSH